MKLSHLIKGLDVKQIYNENDVEITGIHYNSKEITKGNLFVAIEGFVSDGHNYVSSAVQNGAAAILAQKYTEGIDVPQIIVENSRVAQAQVCATFFDNPSKKFTLIGITGTNGKTTCTYLIKHILESSGNRYRYCTRAVHRCVPPIRPAAGSFLSGNWRTAFVPNSGFALPAAV